MVTHRLLDRLRQASQLTTLHLQSTCQNATRAPALVGAVYGEGLPLLVSLQIVRLEGCRIVDANALWPGLAALPALRCLHMHRVRIKVRAPLTADTCHGGFARRPA